MKDYIRVSQRQHILNQILRRWLVTVYPLRYRDITRLLQGCTRVIQAAIGLNLELESSCGRLCIRRCLHIRNLELNVVTLIAVVSLIAEHDFDDVGAP